jgi:hypothetical protein
MLASPTTHHFARLAQGTLYRAGLGGVWPQECLPRWIIHVLARLWNLHRPGRRLPASDFRQAKESVPIVASVPRGVAGQGFARRGQAEFRPGRLAASTVPTFDYLRFAHLRQPPTGQGIGVAHPRRFPERARAARRQEEPTTVPTSARMAARMCSGSVGHAATSAARSASRIPPSPSSRVRPAVQHAASGVATCLSCLRLEREMGGLSIRWLWVRVPSPSLFGRPAPHFCSAVNTNSEMTAMVPLRARMMATSDAKSRISYGFDR